MALHGRGGGSWQPRIAGAEETDGIGGDPCLPEDFVPEESWRGNKSDNTSSVVINNLGKTSVILLATFSGLALGMALYALLNSFEIERRVAERAAQDQKLFEARMANVVDRDRTAEREARVMQERWNDLKVELARRRIPVSDH